MDDKTLEEIRKDPAVRKRLGQESFVWFFAIYFPQYLIYPAAKMHEQMYGVVEGSEIDLSVIVAFRGSAKSTIFSLIYPIWAVLGKQQKNFIVLASNTQKQSGLHFANLKGELEGNELLKQDFGPFVSEDGDWSNSRLIIAPTNARIMTVSIEQSIRGIRHKQYRPDLVVADDIEDMESVKTKEGRDKVEQWLTGEVIPMGDRGTRVIIIGNLLHADSLLMRLKDQIKSGSRDGEFLEFPIIDDDEKITWPGKYLDMASIEKERRKVGNDRSWHREYMLKIINEEGQLVHDEWIQFYDELPNDYEYIAHAVDLAISTKTHADYTAIVSCRTWGRGEKTKIYILPNPVNRRMEFPETIEQIKLMHDLLHGTFYIEEVAYQSSVIQQLRHDGYNVKAVKPQGQDKWMRALAITPLIQNGTILFPRHGCEELIRQLVGFGVEKHDDLVDAFVYLVTKIYDRSRNRARVWAHRPPGW